MMGHCTRHNQYFKSLRRSLDMIIPLCDHQPVIKQTRRASRACSRPLQIIVSGALSESFLHEFAAVPMGMLKEKKASMSPFQVAWKGSQACLQALPQSSHGSVVGFRCSRSPAHVQFTHITCNCARRPAIRRNHVGGACA
eukprot:scaffold25820_cov21-Tisochrysis_lutea.AAC.1